MKIVPNKSIFHLDSGLGKNQFNFGADLDKDFFFHLNIGANDSVILLGGDSDTIRD